MTSLVQILRDKWEGNDTGLREDYRTKLQSGVWIVEFTKADGSAAIMECTLDPKLTPPLQEGVTPRPEQEHLLHVYSLDRQGWRSFKIAMVKSFYKKPESL